MIDVDCARPWLLARLSRPMRCLSWAPLRPGFVTTDQVIWREVRNADLTEDLDAEAWLATEVAARAPGAIGLLTSCNVERRVLARARADGCDAVALVTAGLSNSEAVGHRRPWHAADWGTINILVAVNAGLTEAAQLEALTIAVEARTAAVIEAGIELETGTATGTGTDCLVLACDAGDGRYAGLHTAVGEAVGAATRSAVASAVRDWQGWLVREKLRRNLHMVDDFQHNIK